MMPKPQQIRPYKDLAKYYTSILAAVVGFVGTSALIVANIQANPALINKDFVYVVDTSGVGRIDLYKFKGQPAKPADVQKGSAYVSMYEKGGSGVGNTNYVYYPSTYFNRHPSFLLWSSCVAIGMGFAFGMCPLLFAYWRSGKGKWLALLSAVLAIVVVFASAHLWHLHLILLPATFMELSRTLLYPNTWLLNTFTIGFLVPPLLALAGNFMLTGRLLAYHHYNRGFRLGHLLAIKRQSMWLLVASSVMLVFGIITSSLLRQTVLEAAGAGNSFIFPEQFVTAYSLVFTFFLVIFYLPGNLVLYRLIGKIKRGGTAVNAQAAKAYSVKESFELAIAIGAPVISGLLLELLK